MTATVVTTSAALPKKEKRMRRGRDPSRTPSRPRRPEDSCQELASVVMEKISTEGISKEVQLKE